MINMCLPRKHNLLEIESWNTRFLKEGGEMHETPTIAASEEGHMHGTLPPLQRSYFCVLNPWAPGHKGATLMLHQGKFMKNPWRKNWQIHGNLILKYVLVVSLLFPFDFLNIPVVSNKCCCLSRSPIEILTRDIDEESYKNPCTATGNNELKPKKKAENMELKKLGYQS